jgi:hypothetical protein
MNPQRRNDYERHDPSVITVDGTAPDHRGRASRITPDDLMTFAEAYEGANQGYFDWQLAQPPERAGHD